MKPYYIRGRVKSFQIANYRISRGREVVENAFGILSSRFRVLSDTMLVHTKTVKDIMLACEVLHNILWAERGAGGAIAERDLEDEEIPCGFMMVTQMVVMTGTLPTMPRSKGTS